MPVAPPISSSGVPCGRSAPLRGRSRRACGERSGGIRGHGRLRPAAARLRALPGGAGRALRRRREGRGGHRRLRRPRGGRGRVQRPRRADHGPAGAAVRRGEALPARRPAGHRRRRQGRHGQARAARHQPHRRARVLLPRALQRGAGARLPVALPPGHAGEGHDPRLQPLALRGRARRARQGPGARGAVALALRLDQRLRAHAGARGDDDPQVLPPHLRRRAAGEVPRAPRAHGASTGSGRRTT